jgi:hypothetical protein
MGSPQAWRLGGGLTVPHCKEPACYEMLHRASDLDESFGKTKQRKMNMRFGTLECQESLWVSFSENNIKRILSADGRIILKWILGN